MKVVWPNLPFDMLCRDSYHNQKYLSHHPSSILLAWPPVFRFGLFYLLKSCSKSEKLDFLQKYVQNSYQNGPVDYDRTCGWYLRVLGDFCILHPLQCPTRIPPIGQNSRFWGYAGGGLEGVTITKTTQNTQILSIGPIIINWTIVITVLYIFLKKI